MRKVLRTSGHENYDEWKFIFWPRKIYYNQGICRVWLEKVRIKATYDYYYHNYYETTLAFKEDPETFYTIKKGPHN